MHTAQVHARDHGRADPSLRDVLDAAIARCDDGARMVAFMGQRGAGQEGPDDDVLAGPATAEQLDEVFGRAGALAVALDQTLQPAHVALVTSLSLRDAQPPMGIFLAPLLFNQLAGPDADELERVSRELNTGQQAAPVRRMEIRTLSDRFEVDDELGVERPRCPHCRRSLKGNIDMVTLDVQGAAIEVLACATCGAALAINP
jgi:hypothetical protein